VVEILARPQQYERGLDGLLVASGGRLAHTGEQAAPALRVAHVRLRRRATVYERVPERDVPRMERLELAVEVPAALLEPRRPADQAREPRERLRGPADARGPADERRGVLHVHGRRRALGEVLPERLVQPVESGVRL